MTEQTSARPELFVALVSPLGSRIEALEATISRELSAYGYSCETVVLSGLLENLKTWEPEKDKSEKTRIAHRQACAFKLRLSSGADALARAAISAIRQIRVRRSGHPDRPAPSCAYILRQLKHPKEIQLLRKVYGQSLVVIAGHAPERIRITDLAESMAARENALSNETYRHDAETLIHVDEKEEHPDDKDAECGQNTRDAYPLADLFVSLAHGEPVEPVKRFFELLFGHPFDTPTPEEMAMYHANAMALRSSDERRQVGAVIVARTKRSSGTSVSDADILASGMNEVPRREGGFYWPVDSPDGRDQALRQRGHGNLDDRIKTDVLREIAMRLKNNRWLANEYASLDPALLAGKLLTILKRTRFSDISEFMRQVHAEMAALLDAARRGVAVRGTEMYVTTFPCHNCAKHLIAAGLKKVVYLEPYPKSRAEYLHSDEIELDPDPGYDGDKVAFVPFIGVAPRQYARLFSMSARGRKNGLALEEWKAKQGTLSPQYVLANAERAYTQTERDELQKLPESYRWDRSALCPVFA